MSKKHFEEENKELREKYEELRKRSFSKYIATISQEFSSTIPRLSHLIGDAHDLSVGRYKERILMKFISDFIPGRYSVGTGFVMFPKIDSSITDLDAPSHELSKELDIIIYDSTDYSVIFKDQDFVIVKPESVRAIVEVKGVLNDKQANSFMNSFIDFGNKWARASSFYRTFKLPSLKIPGLFVMNWEIGVNKNGKYEFSGERLMKKIVKKYKMAVKIYDNFETDYPLLYSAFIYDNCIVTLMDYIGIDSIDSIDVGYSILSGKLAKYDHDGKLGFGTDTTIAYLLVGINYYLDMPFNDFFIKPDMNPQHLLSTHGADNFEKWYTRKI